MKRYKNLWSDFISEQNLDVAAHNAVKSKKDKASVRAFLANRSELLAKLRDDLINGRFTTSQYRIRTIYEPKKRDIYILPLYPDHIVHHALINIVGPIWQSTFISDSYACVPGRGLHAASLRLMQFVRRYKYALQCDIRKFYPSISHEIMYKIIKKKIADKRLLALLHDIIFSCEGDKNLPIGNLTSQWMGNVYMNELDHYVKEQLHARAYIRYCDDFIVFSNDKSQLHKIESAIREFVETKLGLTFSKSNIYPTTNGVGFIGYRHYHDFILLRKLGAKKIYKKIMKIVNKRAKTPHSAMQLAAFYGWMKWTNSRNFQTRILQRIMRIRPSMHRFVREKLFVKP